MQITLLWILKVIYYAHGWHLSNKQQPLIVQSFEAWNYGPVVRTVYDAFKESDGGPINTRAKRFDVVANAHREIEDVIDRDVMEFLRNVFDAFSHVDAFDLSNSTHLRGSPWDEVWNAPNGLINVGMKIPNDEIRRWFSDKRAPGFLH
jgi:uncharacterized phage-associated protein